MTVGAAKAVDRYENPMGRKAREGSSPSSRLLSVLDQIRKATLDGTAYTHDPAGIGFRGRNTARARHLISLTVPSHQLLEVTRRANQLEPTAMTMWEQAARAAAHCGRGNVAATDLHAATSSVLNGSPGCDPAFDATQHLFNCDERLRADPDGTIRHMAVWLRWTMSAFGNGLLRAPPRSLAKIGMTKVCRQSPEPQLRRMAILCLHGDARARSISTPEIFQC
jgi:hypothetical protein